MIRLINNDKRAHPHGKVYWHFAPPHDAAVDLCVCCDRIHRFYNPELDLAQRREAKLEARSISQFGTADGKVTNGKFDVAASKELELPHDTV